MSPNPVDVLRSRGYLGWRKAEAAINTYEHYRTEVDRVPVHFMRKSGVGPDPVPLILTHGWPWTFWHWSKVIDPLAMTDTLGYVRAGRSTAWSRLRPSTVFS